MPLRPLPLMLILLLAACGRPMESQVVGILEWDRIELTAETSEPIVEVLAGEGNKVRAGQVILQLDTQRLRARRDEADAALGQAAARLAELRRGPRTERIEQARARLRGFESESLTAANELTRVRTLVQKSLASPEALDVARAEYDRARAERDAARAELEELLTGTTAEELEQAEAARAQAQARLRATEVSLQRLTVRAPSDGRLDTLPFELGERPRSGAVVAVMLCGASPYARVYVPEPLRVRITPANRARIFVDGLAEPFDGSVRMVSRDAVFTPFFSLTERDRSRLSYVAEVELEGARAAELPAGVPVRAEFVDTSGGGG